VALADSDVSRLPLRAGDGKNLDMSVCAQCQAALTADARFCPACGAPVAQRPEPAEERKLATVLFADLVGSTELAGTQDPERTRVLLDRFYDAMAAEIERAGGTVEKFVGDAVMAAFGAPAALEDHAERALHAALAMQQRLAELFGGGLALRIGVNTGEVVVGRAREGSSFVTGDAVNVGARLEQAAAPGEVLVGERTVAAVRGAFELDEPLTVDAKGKPGGVVCRRLVRALSLMRPRGVGVLRRAFVGRESELQQLRTTYAAVASERRPHLVTIIGDAGVGKTRLVRELWAWLAEQSPQPLQRTGRCLSYGYGITYWPLAEVLREHFGLLDNDPAEVVTERLGRDRRWLGLTLGLDIAEGLHPLAARERLHDAWAEFFEELVEETPGVVLIEDLHWAEDDLRELLETLVRQVRGPLFVLATARPELLERHPGWGSGRDASRIVLEALPAADAGRLLDELLGTELPPSLRDVVVERAEGNPFFVEELLATLIDRGVLERRNGGWSFAELPEGFSVPDTVQAVLAARIDLLADDEKAALQAASVIGRVFWSGPVYELVGGSPDLAVLEERDFVRRRAGSSVAGEREYAIKHALTREVAYASLPKAKRAQLHAAFAGWLERSGDGNDEHAALLAHHYAEAVRPEDLDLAWPGGGEQVERLRQSAVEWSRRAAALAIGRYEIDEGLALLRRAAELESDSVRQAELWYEIGHASALKYDGEAFTTAMEKALALGAPAADVYTELGFQTVQRAGMWIRRPSRELVNGWIDRAVELSPEGSVLRAKAVVSRALWNDDEAAAREAQRLAETLGDVELRSYALDGLAGVAWDVGDYAAAAALTEERIRLLPEISDPDHRANAWVTAVKVYPGAGRFADASRAADRLEEVSEGLTPHHRLHAIAFRLDVASLAGRWDEVRQLTPRAEPAVEANLATPCPMNVATLLYCAVAAEDAGDDPESRRLERNAEAIGMEGYGFAFHPPQLRLALARHDLGALRRLVDSLDEEELLPWAYPSRAALFDALVALGDHAQIESEAPAFLRPRTYVEPFALRALGAAREDEELLEQAADRFEAMGLSWHAGETRKLIAGP
jgi:class 3 adenylate cyclase/tetratricopeptide (TPR) repeat protein